MEGELTIIDNLSGSIFHHYSSPAGCEKCHHHKQEVVAASRAGASWWGQREVWQRTAQGKSLGPAPPAALFSFQGC